MLATPDLVDVPAFVVLEEDGAMSDAMWPSVRDAFPAFTAQFEGRLPYMYLDRHDPPLVTTGVGNLIDPVGLAMGLPWFHPVDGRSATPDEIAEAWGLVKARTDLSPLGGGHFGNVTDLRLTDEAIDDLVRTKLAENAQALRGQFASWDNAPAAAQLAALSMAWAAGPGVFRGFPKFSAAFNREDYAAAADESHLAGVGIEPRNAANRELLQQAADVVANGGDRSSLDGAAASPLLAKVLRVGAVVSVVSGTLGLGWLLWDRLRA